MKLNRSEKRFLYFQGVITVIALIAFVFLVGCGVTLSKTSTQNAKIAQYEHTIDGLKQQIASLKDGLSNCETSFEKYQKQQEIAKKEEQVKHYEYLLYIYERDSDGKKKK